MALEQRSLNSELRVFCDGDIYRNLTCVSAQFCSQLVDLSVTASMELPHSPIAEKLKLFNGCRTANIINQILCWLSRVVVTIKTRPALLGFESKFRNE